VDARVAFRDWANRTNVDDLCPFENIEPQEG
jgi:hypothetical protein